jgi:hypothetical protein
MALEKSSVPSSSNPSNDSHPISAASSAGKHGRDAPRAPVLPVRIVFPETGSGVSGGNVANSSVLPVEVQRNEGQHRKRASDFEEEVQNLAQRVKRIRLITDKPVPTRSAWDDIKPDRPKTGLLYNPPKCDYDSIFGLGR